MGHTAFCFLIIIVSYLKLWLSLIYHNGKVVTLGNVSISKAKTYVIKEEQMIEKSLDYSEHIK